MRLIKGMLIAMFLLSGVKLNAQTNYYADCNLGSDNWDGMYPTFSPPNHGPKQTIQATIWLASPTDTVNFTSGPYYGIVEISKDIILVGANDPNISHLKIKDDCNVTLKSNLLVWDAVTIESGQLNTGSSTIHVWNSDPEAVIIKSGQINGEVARRIAAGTTDPYVFTDRLTTFAPNGIQEAMELHVRSFPGVYPPNINGGNAINRYYTVISSCNIIGDLRLSYRDSELGGILENDLALFGHNGSAWLNEGGTVDIDEDFVHKTNVALPSSSMWTLGDMLHPLPIQLAHFNASIISNSSNVLLSWGTLTETNNYGFFVQRRVGSEGVYADLPNNFVPGHGTTLEPHEYSWIHDNVAPGTYYYRLKQVDLDGTIHFTDGREVTVSSLTSVSEGNAPALFQLAQNYPNPFNPSTRIRFTVEKRGFTTLTVFDILGKELGTLYAGTAEPGKLYAVNFDATTLTNGMYFYKLVNNSESSVRKMLLLK
jgi:hypothetical protein